MRIKLSILFTLYLISTPVFSQYTIRGVISDAVTKEPMPFATVFFAGTTIGTTTNEKGGYQLRVDSKGTYDLIVKFIGYETYAAQVTLGAAEVSRLNIEITPGSKDLGSVVVVARKSAQWKRYFNEFEKVFLGTSVNALNAKIVNKEVLDFTFNEEKQQLSAYAYEPLIIENKELGYTVKYYLEQFIIDYMTDVSGYYGYTSFEPMEPKNNRKKKMYESNRAMAYNGSSNHFFKALYKNRLKEEGFVIELNSDLSGEQTRTASQKTIMNEMLRLDPIEKFKQLTFDNYMKISYMNERESTRYRSAVASKPATGLTISSERSRNQESWILLVEGYSSIDFEENGFVRNPISFYSYGYWAFEKVADMVPIDFEPEKK
ncbi:carboxypeptidase-like regulatory domain-containing protein [Roseivirga sp.]|uniref:carboxypeptidase-like regulatory domain-containing protein n=1 Tax=Roseivirga sp. TaxID=1964215 RepID=UPI003B8C0DC3